MRIKKITITSPVLVALTTTTPCNSEASGTSEKAAPAPQGVVFIGMGQGWITRNCLGQDRELWHVIREVQTAICRDG